MNLKARVDRLERQADEQGPPPGGPWETFAHIHRPEGGLTVCMRRVPPAAKRGPLPRPEPGCPPFDFTGLSDEQLRAIVARPGLAGARTMTAAQLTAIQRELDQ